MTGLTPTPYRHIADHVSTSVTLSLAVTKPSPHRPPRPVTVADSLLTEVPMTKTTLALKSTVTRRQTADPVDHLERQLQAEHHQAVKNAAVTTAEPATVEQTEQVTKPKADPHAVQSAFLIGNLGRLVTIYTINGVKLVGKLRQFDQFTLLLQGPDGISSLVFKHGITTIVPVPANDRHE